MSTDRPEFVSLADFYAWLDDHVEDLRDISEGSDLLKPLAEQFKAADKKAELSEAWWEMNAFDAVLKDGILHWQFSGTNDKGDTVVYPDLEKLEAAAFDHFGARLLTVTHPVLKARYAHLLWQGPTKNSQYAQDAVDAYLLAIPIIERALTDHGRTGNGHELIAVVKASFLLAVQCKFDLARPKSELFRLLKDYDPKSPSWFRLRHDLIALILDSKRNFTESELRSIPPFCLATAEHYKNTNIHNAITMYELGESADKKLGLVTAERRDTSAWYLLIAQAFEELMIRRGNESMAAGHFCEEALRYYRKAKVSEKVQELEKKREEFAKKIQLQTVETKVDLTEHLEWCKAIGRELATKEIDEIVGRLVVDTGLLPDPDDVSTTAKESLKNHPLTSLMNSTVMDSRGHVVQHIVTPEQKERREFLNLYDSYIRRDKLHLIHEVICACFSSGKLNCESLFNALEQKSWYCQPVSYIVAEKVIEYRWIDLLQPGLRAYEAVLRDYLEGKPEPSELVLVIDSLTVKFEGIVRDLCKLNGVITTFDKPEESSGLMVTYEKDINRLLREPIFEQLLGKTEIEFLKYLLVEKSGINLRHKIAHCLMTRSAYDLGKAHLLFLGIMRLSRFRLKDGDSSESIKV
ncbi:MAG: DUF4209 domain-containing protein [Candidatus Zixiibacteriota bacterium]